MFEKISPFFAFVKNNFISLQRNYNSIVVPDNKKRNELETEKEEGL